MDDEYFDLRRQEGIVENDTNMYVDAIYFVTTTMTSVGYGDINAFGQGEWSMGIVMFT